MIVIQLARFSCLPIFLLLTSCQSIAPASIGGWEVREFNSAPALEMRSVNVNAEFINQLKDDYKKNPVDSRYPELIFSSAFKSDDSNSFFYVFDILFVDDMQVVYKLNASGLIVDKYIKSQWR